MSKLPGKFTDNMKSSRQSGKFSDSLSNVHIPGRMKSIPTIIILDIHVATDITIKWASYVPYLEVYSGRVGRFQETDSRPFCALMYGGWVSGKSKNVEIFIGVRRRPT